MRDPSRYSRTDHFHERLLQPGRFVTVEAAGEAIRRGQLRWNTTDGWRFALVEDGVRVVVVVGDTETASPVVVTAWTEVEDREAALASDRWDDGDLEAIDLRTALCEHPDEQVPDRIRPRSVQRPVCIGDHRVVTATGLGHVECLDCAGRFRSKHQLTRSLCQR